MYIQHVDMGPSVLVNMTIEPVMTLLLVSTTVASEFLVRHSKAGNTHYRGHVILDII